MSKLILPALRTFLIGAVALGIVLFIPAWTLNYWQAWLFIVVFGLSTNAIGIYLSINDPALLERRKNFGPKQEQNKAQKLFMSLALVGILVLLVLPALDVRLGWSYVSPVVSILGNILLAFSFYMQYVVFRANTFGGSTVQTFEDQKVISTGPYAVVRHPMYAGVLVMVIGAELALGSYWGLLVVLLVTMPVLVGRILDEEKTLKKDLPGYTEYTQKVHYRLVPYLW
jgi:protein-S-isoprenylcysteine O-methyltransferase Ste14